MKLAASDADRLSAAKLWLISPSGERGDGSPRDLPYLAHALYALIPVPSDTVSTMTCDEYWRVYVNPTWLQTAPVPDIAAQLVHLTWHLLHDHAGRARDLRVDAATAADWQQAADAALEPTLRADALAPAGFLTAKDVGLAPDRSAEEYYAGLSRLPMSTGGCGSESAEPQSVSPAIGCGSGCDGLSRSYELPPGLDLGEVGPDAARQIRRRVAIDYRGQRTGRGTERGDAWRWTERILEPKIAWQPLLGTAVRRAVGWTNGNTDYTYSRRSRRQSALPNVVLPGTRRPVPNVALVIDTSGSVDDELLGRALGEVDGALRGLGVTGSSVTVLACDAAVHTVTRVRKARDVTLAGGGGTDLRVGIAAAAALRPRADVVVVFTDGYTPWPHQPPPGSAVIVAMLGRDGDVLPPSPEWAKRIDCRL